jgi:ATP-dependent Zn protease
MKKKKTPSLKLQSTAYHEAGHHAMKWNFGLSLGPVTIKPDDANNTLGTSAYHHLPIKGQTIQRLWEYDTPTPGQIQSIENLVIVCLAGREAERIFRPKKKGLWGASQDYAQAQNMLHILVDEASRQFPIYWKLLLVRTQETLSTPMVWTAVEGLAQALLERETLTGKEAEQAIQEAIQRKVQSR